MYVVELCERKMCTSGEDSAATAPSAFATSSKFISSAAVSISNSVMGIIPTRGLWPGSIGSGCVSDQLGGSLSIPTCSKRN